MGRGADQGLFGGGSQSLQERFYDQRVNTDLEIVSHGLSAAYRLGDRFTLGFGRAMMHTMKQYVEENRHMFATNDRQTRKAVAK